MFDPRRMADDMHDDNKLIVRNLLQQLVAANRIEEEDADIITHRYITYVTEVVAKDHIQWFPVFPSGCGHESLCFVP